MTGAHSHHTQIRPYREIALPWIRLGYPAIPTRGNGDKAPAIRFGHLTGLSQALALAELAAVDGPDGAALVCLDAISGSGMPDLDVVDLDDPADEAAVLAVTGASPLTATTGRVGGGRHHYFRRDPYRARDEHGSIVGFLPGLKADWKSWHGYVVAPGSTHRTGVLYRLYWHGAEITPADLTPGMLRSLPVLDRGVVRRAMGAEAPPVPAWQDFSFGETGGGGTRRPMPGAGAVQAVLTPEQAAVYRGVERMARVHPPCCGGRQKSPAGTVLSHQGGPLVIKCHRHLIIWREVPSSPEPERETPVALETLAVEERVHELCRDGRYAEALRVVDDEVTGAHDETVCRLVDWALDGQAGVEAEAEAEAEAEGAREEAAEVYASRMRAKAERAAQVPLALRRGAEVALALADDILPLVMARRESLGLPRTPPVGAAPCGVPIALQHGTEALVRGVRICRDEDCPVHGPVQQARRIAASVCLPLVGKPTYGGGSPSVGEPLGSVALYEYRFPRSLLGKWSDKWGREGYAGNSAYLDPRSSRRNFPHSLHGYVAYDLGDGMITLLSTARLTFRRSGGRVSPLATSEVGEVPAEEAKSRLVELGILAVRVRGGGIDPDLDVEVAPEVVRGAMTSSQTLHLDPESLVRTAQAAPWLAAGEVPLHLLRDGLKAAQVPTMATDDDRGNTLRMRTENAVRPETLLGIITAAGGTTYGKPRPPRPAMFHDPATDQLDEIEIELRMTA